MLKRVRQTKAWYLKTFCTGEISVRIFSDEKPFGFIRLIADLAPKNELQDADAHGKSGQDSVKTFVPLERSQRIYSDEKY